MNLAIKLNTSRAPRLCPLCARPNNPNIGPELNQNVLYQIETKRASDTMRGAPKSEK